MPRHEHFRARIGEDPLFERGVFRIVSALPIPVRLLQSPRELRALGQALPETADHGPCAAAGVTPGEARP